MIVRRLTSSLAPPTTIAQLRQVIQRAWDTETERDILHLYYRLHGRIAASVAVRAGAGLGRAATATQHEDGGCPESGRLERAPGTPADVVLTPRPRGLSYDVASHTLSLSGTPCPRPTRRDSKSRHQLETENRPRPLVHPPPQMTFLAALSITTLSPRRSADTGANIARFRTGEVIRRAGEARFKFRQITRDGYTARPSCKSRNVLVLIAGGSASHGGIRDSEDDQAPSPSPPPPVIILAYQAHKLNSLEGREIRTGQRGVPRFGGHLANSKVLRYLHAYRHARQPPTCSKMAESRWLGYKQNVIVYSLQAIHRQPVARALASHHGDLDSIPGGFAPGFSHLEIVLDDAACRRVFSGYSRFHRPCSPVPLHPRVTFHVMSGDDGHLWSQLESLSLREGCLALSSLPTRSHRYTQHDENTAHQSRILRLAAMGDLMRVAVSPLTLPRLSASNAEKAPGRRRLKARLRSRSECAVYDLVAVGKGGGGSWRGCAGAWCVAGRGLHSPPCQGSEVGDAARPQYRCLARRSKVTCRPRPTHNTPQLLSAALPQRLLHQAAGLAGQLHLRLSSLWNRRWPHRTSPPGGRYLFKGHN
ncbi:hypothetical protein PR048_006599 [Dryococelus australis]|uniref:Uncharacterized protein n=1 Tax=Dryococelus australis TaxID=614101 RepID=A0ABQ9IC30_9NEOP|nr:hypothetical protein PR048_006599 [Dryococelus australis]